MPISATSQATTSITASLHKVERAAGELASLSVASGKDNESDTGNDIIRPIIELTKAELETSAAAKLIRTETEKIGSILDVKA